MPLDLDKIRALLSSLNAPNGWVYMRDDSAFPCEIRERAGFREVVTLAADPNDLAEAIAALPEMLAALLAEVDRLRARCLPVPVWQPGKSEVFHPYQEAVVGQFTLHAYDDCWGLLFRNRLVAEGPETGEAGKAAAVAAWRRVCGLEAANPGA